MTNKPLLQISNLTVSYEEKIVLNKLNLTLPHNKIACIVGSSGCGKSTLLKAICGLLPKSALIKNGQIYYQGIDLLQDPLKLLSLLGSDISMLFQNPEASLYPHKTIEKQILLLPIATTTPNILNVAKELFKKLGLIEPKKILQSYPFQLSGGMNQRVCLAMALLLQPKFLLADEPTTGLDLINQQAILNTLLKLKQEQNFSLLIVSHNIAVASQIADILIVMDHGQIIEFGSTEEILNNPKAALTKKLLQAIPLLRRITYE